MKSYSPNPARPQGQIKHYQMLKLTKIAGETTLHQETQGTCAQ